MPSTHVPTMTKMDPKDTTTASSVNMDVQLNLTVYKELFTTNADVTEILNATPTIKSLALKHSAFDCLTEERKQSVHQYFIGRLHLDISSLSALNRCLQKLLLYFKEKEIEVDDEMNELIEKQSLNPLVDKKSPITGASFGKETSVKTEFPDKKKKTLLQDEDPLVEEAASRIPEVVPLGKETSVKTEFPDKKKKTLLQDKDPLVEEAASRIPEAVPLGKETSFKTEIPDKKKKTLLQDEDPLVEEALLPESRVVEEPPADELPESRSSEDGQGSRGNGLQRFTVNASIEVLVNGQNCNAEGQLKFKMKLIADKGAKEARNATVFKSKAPVACHRCYAVYSNAYNLKRHLEKCDGIPTKVKMASTMKMRAQL